MRSEIITYKHLDGVMSDIREAHPNMRFFYTKSDDNVYTLRSDVINLAFFEAPKKPLFYQQLKAFYVGLKLGKISIKPA